MCFLELKLIVKSKSRRRGGGAASSSPQHHPVSILSMLRVALVSESPDAGDSWKRNGDKGCRSHLSFSLAISQLTNKDNRCIRELLRMLIQQPWWPMGTLLGTVDHGC